MFKIEDWKIFNLRPPLSGSENWLAPLTYPEIPSPTSIKLSQYVMAMSECFFEWHTHQSFMLYRYGTDISKQSTVFHLTSARTVTMLFNVVMLHRLFVVLCLLCMYLAR